MKKFLNKSNKNNERKPKPQKPIKKPETNPRDKEGSWENELATRDYDFWDEIGEIPKMKNSPVRPTAEQLKQAAPLIQALLKFDKGVEIICNKANRAINFKEFIHIEPGKYCLSGDDKTITIWKYFAGYECYEFCKKYPTTYVNGKDKGVTPEADEAWAKLNRAFDTFEDEIYDLGETIAKSDLRFNRHADVIWCGKDNTDMPPSAEYRLYWCIELSMDIN